MPARLRHFAVNADDPDRARRFYETVMGWSYAPWGPPDFYVTDSAGVRGALQARRDLDGRPQRVELTYAVEDLAETMAAIEAHGGRIVEPPFRIEGVGELVWFADTEGNVMGAMQYDQEEPR